MSCSCAERACNQLHPEDIDDRMCPLKRKRKSLKTPYKTMCIEHNGKGHVFLSHFLGTCMPSKMFKAHPQLVDKYLEEVVRDMTQLFHVGLECDAGTFYAACIGVKGDFEYHMEIAKFTRTYLNVGTVNDRPFCPYCRAGDRNIPATDMQDTPTFQATLYSDNPWHSLPVLNHIPYDPSTPVSLYRKDVFHTLKYGFLRDLNAGVILWLSYLGLFDSAGDSTSIDSRLERAYSCFKLWCVTASKTTTLRKFSKENLHRQTMAKFPYTSGKGSDSIVLMQWLQWFVRLKLVSPNVPEKQLLMAMQGGSGLLRGYAVAQPANACCVCEVSTQKWLAPPPWLCLSCGEEHECTAATPLVRLATEMPLLSPHSTRVKNSSGFRCRHRAECWCLLQLRKQRGHGRTHQ